jgi:hypothetical protein
MTEKSVVYSVLNNIITVISMAVLGVLAICSLLWQAGVYMNSAEQVHFDRSGILFYVVLAAMSWLLIRAGKYAVKCRLVYLYAIFSVIYILAAVYLLVNMDVIPRGDPAMVLKYADAFNQGDYSGLLPGKYLDIYPYQLGLLTYERLLRLISKDYHFLAAVNLFLVLLINAFCWKITDLVSEHDPKACFYSILLSFLFLPQFFYILWMYGQIPGLCCISAAILFLVRWIKGIGKRNWLYCAVFLALAVLIKPNFMIAAAAVCILLFLCAIRRKQWRPVLIMAFIIFLVCSSQKLLEFSYRQVSGIDFGEGTPTVLVLAEGLQDTGPRLGGWYNGFEFDTYYKADYDTTKAAEIGKAALYERMTYLMSHPKYAMTFLTKKIVSTWCDPTFDSIWSGALEDCGQYSHTFLLQSIYTAGIAYEVLKLFMHTVTLLQYVLSFLFLYSGFKNRSTKTDPWNLFPALYLTGGFLFHLISETKSQYVYMYVFCLIPAASVMLAELHTKKEK